MCDVNESNSISLEDLAIDPQDLTDSKNMMYNDRFDPDINFLNLRKHQGLCNYYNEEEFNIFTNSLLDQGHKNIFSTFHLNIRSLPKNYDYLLQYLSTLNHTFSILALSETWLNDEIVSAYSVSHYNAVHSCRQNKKGGGVSIFVDRNFQFIERQELSNSFDKIEVESLFIEIQSSSSFGGKNVIIGCIYRPPDTDVSIFNDVLSSTIELISNKGRVCILLGDFNIDILKSESNLSTEFLNIFYASYFHPLIYKPTRITNKSATLIDNIFTNYFDHMISSGLLLTDISDHLPIFQFFLTKTNPQDKSDVRMKCRKFTKKNEEYFVALMEEASWEEVFKNQDAELAYFTFMKTFTSIFDKCFPLQTNRKCKPRNSKPWITPGLQRSSIRKNKLYKKCVVSPTPLNIDIYKKYKNYFIKLLQIAKKNYFSEKFEQSRNDIKNTWDLINELLNKKKASTTIPSQLSDGVRNFTNLFDITNGFNDFFVNIGPSLAKNIGSTDESVLADINEQYPHIRMFDPPTSKEVHDIILDMKNSAAGHDEIRSSLLKKVAVYIVEPLTHVLSLSLKTGVVPRDLKLARVIPLFKSGDSSMFTNYRPISVLPCFSKVLEKLVYSRIKKHLDESNILYSHQYGFREKRSTEMALSQLVHKISTALDNKKISLGIFLDLSKAFDTVDHNILIAKLHKYGFHDVALKWLNDYLKDREQYVSINMQNSNRVKLLCGVPQGSILGPLLFLIYMNDLPSVCNTVLPLLFADDTCLNASHENFSTLIREANEELSSISKWFQMNKLSLNINKSNFIIFCNKNKKYAKEEAKLFIDNIRINQVPIVKFLGVIVDEKLTWKHHIQFVCKKIIKSIGILSRVRSLINHSCILIFYYSLIYPYIMYCNTVWAATCPTFLNMIFSIQKKFLRMMSLAKRSDSSAPLFRKFKLLSIFNVNIYQTCVFMYKYVHLTHQLPSTFQNFFTFSSDRHSYNTRRSEYFHLPYCRTSLCQHTLKYRGPSLWNNLPPSLQSTSTLSLFKKHLKNFLMSKDL